MQRGTKIISMKQMLLEEERNTDGVKNYWTSQGFKEESFRESNCAKVKNRLLQRTDEWMQWWSEETVSNYKISYEQAETQNITESFAEYFTDKISKICISFW